MGPSPTEKPAILGGTKKSVSIYQASIPGLIHTLKDPDTILAKAAARAEAKKIDPTVVVNSYPDMFALARQC